MPSLFPGYEYDIFISYRQKDNRGDKWVTEFVHALKTELDATFKEDISIYFDENPHDGLLETHVVDKSLEGKLKCLLFIPILSQTYCDPKSFAWQHEFCAFNKLTAADSLGRDIQLANGNVASRILPIKIYDLDPRDKALVEQETGGALRAIEFIYKEPGVNRPLKPADQRSQNLNKTDYRNQVNKVANAIKEILQAMCTPAQTATPAQGASSLTAVPKRSFWQRAKDRGLVRVALVYAVFAAVVFRLVQDAQERTLLTPGWAAFAYFVIAIGFPAALWLAWQFEFSPEGIIRTSSAASTANPYSTARKKPLTGNLTLLILLLLLLAQVALFAPSHKKAQTNSIAVLYFDNISNDPEQEPFSDGITEEITAHLSRIPSLRVTSRTSVLPYKGKTKAMNIRQMADELGVDNILEGSVRKSGTKLRITAQLIEAHTDKHLWTEVYDREVSDVFEIQSEIAKAIASKFNVVISREASARLNEVPTKNMRAYELYLKARVMPEPAGGGIGTYYGSTRKGISYLKEAIRLDPDFGGAYFLMGQLYSKLEGGRDSAVAMTKEGIIRNPGSSEGYKQLSDLTGEASWLKRSYTLDTLAGLLSYGEALWNEGELAGAMRCYTEARRRAPNSVAVLMHIGSSYGDLRIQDSVKKYRQLVKQLDPQSRDAIEFEFLIGWMGQYPGEAEWKQILQRYYADDSLSYYKALGIYYLFNRRWRDAEAAYARTDYRDMDVGLLLMKTNRVDSGRRVLQQSLAYHLLITLVLLGLLVYMPRLETERKHLVTTRN